MTTGHETINELRAEIRKVLSEGHESRVETMSKLTRLDALVTAVEARMGKIEIVEDRLQSTSVAVAVLSEKVKRLEAIVYALCAAVGGLVVAAVMAGILK